MGTLYPKEPMYRIAYTKLTPEQILAKLAPAAKGGPASASPLSDALAGKTIKIVTDKGPTLAYKFTGNTRLSVAEGDGKPVQAGYAAQTLDRILFFTHLIPGTQRGFAVVIDRASNLATVIELWFSGYKDNREVQREIWQGYVDGVGEAPKKRHAATNRFEGKGFYWKQDAGPETLEYYPSAGYSHFVELSRQGGEFGYCAPSDYVQIDDEYYIYTRVECEFSGTFTAYVVDLNRAQQIGVRLGFDPADKLEYYVFRGNGEWLGQIAQFEKFGDIAGNPIPRPGPEKGSRRVYRPLLTMPKMSKAEVAAAVARNSRAFVTRTGAGSGAAGMATNGVASSGWLAGKKLTLRYDNGPAVQYQFDDAENLSWRFEGKSDWIKARYKAWESAPGAFIFGHLLEGMPDHDGHMIVADFDQGLVTCFNGFLNTPYIANDADVRVLFGVIEMDGITPPMRQRHEFTDELVGTALTWNYAPGLTSMHLYSTPNTTSWIIFTDSGAGGMEWSGPGGFVKIRDGLYFAYWLESACNGTLGTILINMRTMHDAGIGYHCGTEGLSMSQVGAHGRHAGKFNVARYFQPRTKREEA